MEFAKKIKNNDSKSIFIPTKTSAQYNNFLNNSKNIKTNACAPQIVRTEVVSCHYTGPLMPVSHCDVYCKTARQTNYIWNNGMITSSECVCLEKGIYNCTGR